MQSVMQHTFSQVPRAEIPRSSFNRSHGHKTTFDAGLLVPIFVDEALPGDTFKVRMTAFGRLATPIYPVMDNMVMESFFFSVPIRLIWDNWQKFNGEQVNPGDSTDYLVPQVVAPAAGYNPHSMGDYMGLPTGVGSFSHSALWFRAYNLIWNEWFRDQNLQTRVPIHRGDGPDPVQDYAMCRRGKRHDYFTSCLPWPQKGPGVTIPLGSLAPVKGLVVADAVNVAATGSGRDTAGNVYPAGTSYGWNSAQPGYIGIMDQVQAPGTSGVAGHGPAVYADLAQATAATINSLRQAFQIQKIYERDARGGTRYTEIIRAHFGVTSPDARLQRPEFLGGGSSPVNISPVPQTSATDSAVTPQGNLAAMGTVNAHGHGFTASFTEHCVLIGLVSVRADLTYQQGLDRMFSRRTRFDFYWPALAHIGEQAVLSKEIYLDNTAADNDVFGYQERYAEYRYKPSKITGKFRSSDAQTLDAWHLSQDFTTRPVLNSSFIREDPPIDRVIAVPTQPHFLLDTFFSQQCARPMPVYGVPGMIDHF